MPAPTLPDPITIVIAKGDEALGIILTQTGEPDENGKVPVIGYHFGADVLSKMFGRDIKTSKEIAGDLCLIGSEVLAAAVTEGFEYVEPQEGGG